MDVGDKGSAQTSVRGLVEDWGEVETMKPYLDQGSIDYYRINQRGIMLDNFRTNVKEKETLINQIINFGAQAEWEGRTCMVISFIYSKAKKDQQCLFFPSFLG